MVKAAGGFGHRLRAHEAAAPLKPARQWPLAEALPLIVFGGTCLGLAGWLVGSHTAAYLGHYALWPYLATIGGISAAGGTASLFATWEEEPEPAERAPNPDEVLVPRDEYESLIRTALAEKAAARAREEQGAGPSPAVASASVAAGTPETEDWSEARELADPPKRGTSEDWVEPTPQPVPAELARTASETETRGTGAQEPATEVAVPRPSSPSSDSRPAEPAAGGAAPQVVLQSFLARLRPAVDSAKGPVTAAGDASAPSSTTSTAPPEVAVRSAPRSDEGALPAQAATSSPPTPAEAGESSGSTGTVAPGEIEHEFDKLLEALSSGSSSTAGSSEPLCISCDKPVQLPYGSCQGCGNPLCAECRAAAAEEGHPRRCPTCALLQKYSQ